MPLAKLPTATVDGITASPVTVEVDVSNGLPSFSIIGLADKLVDESRERVRSAVKNIGFRFPLSRITVHLSPSEIKKSGAHFDLPIALGLLLADKQIVDNDKFKNSLILGGLSLDGQLQPIRGALVLTEWAKNNGVTTVVLPAANAKEAGLVEGITVLPAENIRQVIDWLGDEIDIEAHSNPQLSPSSEDDEIWMQIRGQERAKRAALVAAAGGHSILLHGPPGAGKSMLAKALRSLLPELTRSELIETIKLHSVAGMTQQPNGELSFRRPLRSPHHSASHISVIGGGNNYIRPGEISLAHRGVLFMDELPEFPRIVIEAMRQPLEDRSINVARANSRVVFPADFIMVATMNPCPCGWYESGLKECSCSIHQIERYRKKISGPILDRIDMSIQMVPVPLSELQGESSVDVDSLKDARRLVDGVWKRSMKRSGAKNSELGATQITKHCRLDDDSQRLLEASAQKFVITGRGFHKLLRVARTVADINGHVDIQLPDLAEALQYRFS